MRIVRKYGPNNLENSSLCFGTMQFGDGASERDSHEMYEACRISGINFFDTAYVYTGGKSEVILHFIIQHMFLFWEGKYWSWVHGSGAGAADRPAAACIY